jgi:hypothetical protein
MKECESHGHERTRGWFLVQENQDTVERHRAHSINCCLLIAVVLICRAPPFTIDIVLLALVYRS